MFTTLVAVIVALAMRRFSPNLLMDWRQLAWYQQWIGLLVPRLSPQLGWRAVVAILIPPLAVVGVCQWSLHGPGYGILGFILQMTVFLLAWDPQQSPQMGQSFWQAAQQSGEGQRDIGDQEYPQDVREAELLLLQSLRGCFAVIVWFWLFGAVGALFYRLTILALNHFMIDQGPPLHRARWGVLQHWLEWPVMQLMAISMALVGNYDAVLRVWGQTVRSDGRSTEQLFAELAHASRFQLAQWQEPLNVVNIAAQQSLLARYMSQIIDRMLWLWLLILALLVIAGWVG